MFRIGICDDDETFAIQLEEYIIQYAKTKNLLVDTQTFSNADDLFQNMEEEGLFEILFLDIQLNDTTGIDIGRKIRTSLKNEAMQIVYVSSKEGYAMQLFDIRPMNFLIKPVDYGKVVYILEEYDRLYNLQNKFFQYSIGKSQNRINERYIIYFQSQGRKIKMVTQNDSIEFYGKLSDVILQLNEHSFLNVHKSYVINTNYVVEYRKDSILMANGESIPISQSMKKHVKQKILENTI